MAGGRSFVRRVLKAAAVALAALVAAGVLLYAAGLRIVLDGSGSPGLEFVESGRARAERLARHRAAQREQAADPAPARPAADAAAPEAVSAPTAAAPEAVSAPTAVAPRASSIQPFWTSFRGPARNGAYDQRPIRTEWPSDGLRPLYRQPVGMGYASFVAARGRAFTIEQRGGREVVAAYDVATGRELWTDAWDAAFREMMGGDGPRATPTWHDGVVYALGAEGELRALDEGTGRVRWRTNILRDAGAANLPWGMAASPLVVDDTVVVLPGGGNGQSVAAYSRQTGQRVWAALSDQGAYSSPMLVTLGGVRQVLVFTASRLAGLTPDGGGVLWEYPWKTPFDINAAQPLILSDSRVFLSSGNGTGGAVIEVSAAEGGLAVRELWRNIRMKNQFTSSVLHDGFIYGLDEAILACLDAATGELKWKGGRYGHGQVMLASGHLLVLTEDGQLALVRATPDRHHELASFPVLDGKTWNHPAMDDGILLLRNMNEMTAFDLRTK